MDIGDLPCETGRNERNAYLDTFSSLWKQLRAITSKTLLPNNDDMVICTNLLDQMVRLLQLELSRSYESSGFPCLNLLIKENIPAHVLGTSRMPVQRDLQENLRLNLLRLYLTIFEKTSALQSALAYESISRPLLELLSETDANNNGGDSRGLGNRDSRALVLINQICGELMCNEALLYLFVEPEEKTKGERQISKNSVLPTKFLIKFIHEEDKWIGQHSRDSMLGCISLTERVPNLDYYISEYTDFCPVLAGGLSALYSSLPRRLSSENESYHITDMDIAKSPPLRSFLSSLLFCNAVVQMSQKHVKRNILDLVHMGFLVPVLGPALIQTSEEESTCATAYCDLCLRKINSSLLGLFLKFLFTSNIEEIPIIDILTKRLRVKTKLSLVTLRLFYTLIDLNCEDVQFWLILKYLVPLKHILPSHRSCIIQPDLHARGSGKFLALMPICCQNEYSERSSMTTNSASVNRMHCCCYTYYLHDAKIAVRFNLEATKHWIYSYDGIEPSVKSNKLAPDDATDRNVECSICDTNTSLYQEETDNSKNRFSRIREKVGPLSRSQPELNTRKRSDHRSLSLENFPRVSDDSELFSNLDSKNNDDITPDNKEAYGTVLGPFLEMLFDRVECMASNGLTVNLLITSIISRLAAYPQPLLKSILLHPDPIFQPYVRNLFRAISSLKQEIDNSMPSLKGSEEALVEARRYLNSRIYSVEQNVQTSKPITEARPRRTLSSTFSSFFRKRSETVNFSSLPHTAAGDKAILSFEVQNYALTAVIIEDWLKELSAIAHEHSVLQKELSFQFGMGLANCALPSLRIIPYLHICGNY